MSGIEQPGGPQQAGNTEQPSDTEQPGNTEQARNTEQPDRPGTQRIRLGVSYYGRDFAGWAIQPGQRTVQGTLEEWIPKVMRLTDPVQLICAGRTDAGVHARGQVVHVDLPADFGTVESLHRRLSRALPTDMVVTSVDLAPDGFDARFSASWRRYTYRISDGSVFPDPLLRGHVTRIKDTLDVEAMNAAAPALLGYRDFAAFCRKRPGATTIRTLTTLEARRTESGMIEYSVIADAFCHSMVRSVMGAMTAIGAGDKDRAWLHRTVAARVRANDVTVMPAKGLCLEEVGYPVDAELATRARQARSLRTLVETGPRGGRTDE